MYGFLPQEPGCLSDAGKIRDRALPRGSPDKLLAQGGNGEGGALNSPPVYYELGGMPAFPKQVPVPMQDEPVIPVSANGFGIRPSYPTGYRRKVQTAVHNNLYLFTLACPAGDKAYAALE